MLLCQGTACAPPAFYGSWHCHQHPRAALHPQNLPGHKLRGAACLKPHSFSFSIISSHGRAVGNLKTPFFHVSAHGQACFTPNHITGSSTQESAIAGVKRNAQTSKSPPRNGNFMPRDAELNPQDLMLGCKGQAPQLSHP